MYYLDTSLFNERDRMIIRSTSTLKTVNPDNLYDPVYSPATYKETNI